MSRKCGPCGACCEAMRIPELGKPARTPCPHWSQAARCGVYTARPGSCRAFECLWLQGLGSEPERPDLLGAMFTLLKHKQFGPVLQVHELEPDAYDRGRVRDLVQKFVDDACLVLRIAHDGWACLEDGPPALLRVARIALDAERAGLHLPTGFYTGFA